jgi:hypothetical protein
MNKIFKASQFLLLCGCSGIVFLSYIWTALAQTCDRPKFESYFSEIAADNSQALVDLFQCQGLALQDFLDTIDQTSNSQVRAGAIYALVNEPMLSIARQKPDIILPILVSALQDSNNDIVRLNSAFAIGDLAIKTEITTQALIKVLETDSNQVAQRGAAYALGTTDPINQVVIEGLLEATSSPDEDLKIYAARSLGLSARALADRGKTDPNTIDENLKIVQQIHESVAALNSPELLRPVEESIQRLEQQKQVLILNQIKQWLFTGKNILLTHAILWIVLMSLYPQSPQIQAIFFWNPKIRKFFGFFYVGLALTWIPFLRSRLFAPFKDSLLADADLERFQVQYYFPNCQVQSKATGKISNIQEAIPEIKGQIILQGESGLGKSMFLRSYLQKSKRIAVFLRATRCTQGSLGSRVIRRVNMKTQPIA